MKYYETEFTIKGNDALMQDSCDLLAAMAGEAGYESFEETDCGLKGYIQQDLYDEEALKQIIGDFPFEDMTITHVTREAEYRDWNEQWENEGFSPIFITDDCVVHDGRHMPDTPAKTMVEIDAKLAFGTGTHDTTKMVARQLIEANPEGKSLLDCGCGTGILGIIALKYGAEKVVGYDIDEWSADNARHNAVINGVGDSYDARLGDAAILDSSMSFDIILANINRNILIADMPIWRPLMKKGAKLIISGFYAEDVNKLTAKAEELALALESHHNEGEWHCLVFTSE
ncbi:MAG: 50S ribosomal protein L11 methyltransferase [Prevotella sp.]